MKIDSFEDGLKLAQEFLPTKERANYYGFTTDDEETGQEILILNKLDKKEVAGLRALKEKYGEKYTNHLDEAFDNPDFVHDLTYGGNILDLDLDTVWHMYGITLHELLSDGTLRSKPCKIELSDDDYIRLIAWHLYDKNLTINRLRYHDHTLYGTIINGADGMYCHTAGFFDATEPFLLTLDEAQTDAELLVKWHCIEYNNGTMLVPMF